MTASSDRYGQTDYHGIDAHERSFDAAGGRSPAR